MNPNLLNSQTLLIASTVGIVAYLVGHLSTKRTNAHHNQARKSDLTINAALYKNSVDEGTLMNVPNLSLREYVAKIRSIEERQEMLGSLSLAELDLLPKLVADAASHLLETKLKLYMNSSYIGKTIIVDIVDQSFVVCDDSMQAIWDYKKKKPDSIIYQVLVDERMLTGSKKKNLASPSYTA